MNRPGRRVGRGGLRPAVAVLAALLVAVVVGVVQVRAPGGIDEQPPAATISPEPLSAEPEPLTSAPEPLSAAIIDQLGATLPSAEFASSCLELLEAAGYRVDYYSSEQVTVDFYRELPSYGYDLVLFRTHVGRTRRVDLDTGKVTWPDYVSIFTGEPYDGPDKYLKQGVGLGEYLDISAPPVYAVTARFFELIMEGRFDDTVVVMMGCDGLRWPRTAEAFLGKGAKAFVSWNDYVTADHSDRSTLRLLEMMFEEARPLEEAVSETSAELGPDPWYAGEIQVVSRPG